MYNALWCHEGTLRIHVVFNYADHNVFTVWAAKEDTDMDIQVDMPQREHPDAGNHEGNQLTSGHSAFQQSFPRDSQFLGQMFSSLAM